MKVIQFLLRECLVLIVLAGMVYLYCNYKLNEAEKIYNTTIAHYRDNNSKGALPPDESFYSAYDWLEWGAYNGLATKPQKAVPIFNSFQNIFHQRLENTLGQQYQDSTYWTKWYDQTYIDSLKTSYRALYPLLANTNIVFDDSLARNFDLSSLDTIVSTYAFEYLIREDTVYNLCRAWYPFLAHHSSRLDSACCDPNVYNTYNCCSDIIDLYWQANGKN